MTLRVKYGLPHHGTRASPLVSVSICEESARGVSGGVDMLTLPATSGVDQMRNPMAVIFGTSAGEPGPGPRGSGCARRASRGLTACAACVACALAVLAVPALAHAGTLSYNAATNVLTYAGSDAENVVFADHPTGDTAHVRVVDVGGEDLTSAGAPACVADDSDFYLVCPTPARVVVQLRAGDDSFTDDTISGDPIAIPVDVDGGAGADEFDGGGGADVLRGGLGNDTIAGDGGIDVISGDDGNDTLEGGAGHDDLAGGPGSDRLSGGHGNDAVRGGDGDDDLDYSPEYELDGSDLVEGGTGSDAFGYFGRTISVSVSLDGQANDGQAGENDNVGADIEGVDGSDSADVLTGSAGPDGLAGRGGDDQIAGLAGSDLIYGDSGNDSIDGGDGDDDLDGGCHDDVILGGPGIDSLSSDGTCEDPALRGFNDVLNARDGVRDSLVLCTMSGPAGDTAIVDAVDPAVPAGDPGGCRTIDAGATTAPAATTTPGGTAVAGGTAAPGTTPPGGTTTSAGAMALGGTVRARLGPALRLLTGNAKPGQAARQLVNLKARPATLTLGSLIATSPARLTTRATIRIRGRKVSLGSVTVSVAPAAPRTLRLTLSTKSKSALARSKAASISVRFTEQEPVTKKIRHQSTKTFRITIKR